MTTTVQIVLFDGFDLLDAIAPYEVFCAAALYTEQAVNVQFVTAEGARSVPSGVNGLEIKAGGRLDPGLAGIILVPGAAGDVDGDGHDSIPSRLARTVTTPLPALVGQALEREGVIVATVCGGSLALAMAGLLEGRTAVTHHLGMGLLEATGAVAVPARVVDDGNLVSGGGVTSGLDVALYLVERELGPRIAHQVEQLFEFERRGTVWRKSGMTPSLSKPSPLESEPDIDHDMAGDIASITADAIPHNTGSASVFDGEWNTEVATPIGKLKIRLSITSSEGRIRGQATQGDEIVEFLNPALRDNKLIWSLRIRKPMRLHLKFEVDVDGDRITGTVKAGLLPASALTGMRVPSQA